VVDFNNMFSFQGGGIRTYHERKLRALGARDDVDYTLVVPSDRDASEAVHGSTLRHLYASAVPFTAGYRHRLDPRGLRELFGSLAPDVVEVGGCYVDPLLMRWATRGMDLTLLGFWHTDYPTAYFRYYGAKASEGLGDVLERVGWWYARQTYGALDAVIAVGDCVVENLVAHGVPRVMQCPLGVDTEGFHPQHRSAELRARYGAEERPLIFFPHRLIREKGIFELVQAAPGIRARTGAVMVFAGDGPGRPKVEALARAHEDLHYVGYLTGREEMARHLASADLVFALSPYETFGFSIVEAMASGVPLVGPGGGAGRDWIQRAGCGVTIAQGDARILEDATVALARRPDRAELGRRGRRFVEANLSWDHVFERQLELYRRAVDHRRGRRSIGQWPLRWRPDAAADPTGAVSASR